MPRRVARRSSADATIPCKGSQGQPSLWRRHGSGWVGHAPMMHGCQHARIRLPDVFTILGPEACVRQLALLVDARHGAIDERRASGFIRRGDGPSRCLELVGDHQDRCFTRAGLGAGIGERPLVCRAARRSSACSEGCASLRSRDVHARTRRCAHPLHARGPSPRHRSHVP